MATGARARAWPLGRRSGGLRMRAGSGGGRGGVSRGGGSSSVGHADALPRCALVVAAGLAAGLAARCAVTNAAHYAVLHWEVRS
jgi:hypothetical protein